MSESKISKIRTMILGAVAFWFFSYGIILLAWLNAGELSYLSGSLNKFIREIFSEVLSIYHPFYILPFLLIGCFSFLSKERLEKLRYLLYFLPLLFSFLLYFPYLFLAGILGVEGRSPYWVFTPEVEFAGAIQLISCLVLARIVHIGDEKIIPKLTLISVIFIISTSLYTTLWAKQAYQAKPLIENLFKEAIETGDISLCEKIYKVGKKKTHYYDKLMLCVLSAAVKAGDASLCDTIKKYEPSVLTVLAKTESCRKRVFLKTFLETTDLCKGILEEEEKQNCIKRIAIETNDLELCEKIFVLPECIMAIAVKTHNPELCSRREVDNDKCFYELALSTNNPEICERIESELDRHDCLRELAYQLSDPEVCGKIKDEFNRDGCFRGLAQKLNNPQLCKKILKESRQEECFKMSK